MLVFLLRKARLMLSNVIFSILFFSKSFGNQIAIDSGGSKGEPGWAMDPRFLLGSPFGPPSFFLNIPLMFVWLTYAGLPNLFCKNTGHFVNSARSELCLNS